MPQPNKPMTPHDVIGLLKNMKRPEMKTTGLVTKQAILINILLKFINNPLIMQAVWEAGFDGLSDAHKESLGVKVAQQ